MTNKELLQHCEAALGKDWTKKRAAVVDFLVAALSSGPTPPKQKAPRAPRTTELTGTLVVRSITKYKYSKPTILAFVQDGSVRIGDQFTIENITGTYTGKILTLHQRTAAVYKVLTGNLCTFALDGTDYVPVPGDVLRVSHRSPYKPT